MSPTSVPSVILIRPADWPQYTNVTDRTDTQDNSPLAQGEPLLVMVAQKRLNRSRCRLVFGLGWASIIMLGCTLVPRGEYR